MTLETEVGDEWHVSERQLRDQVVLVASQW